MTNARTNPERAGPLWAVVVAPLVGVPVMVALLVLGSGPPVDPGVDRDAGIAVEQVNAPEMDQRAEGDAWSG